MGEFFHFENLSYKYNLNNKFDDFLQLTYIRSVELIIAERYKEQIFRCPVHLSIGQEAISVGVCKLLVSKDKVIAGHRAHAAYLAKGGSLTKFFLELLGNPKGCCGGKGGSMHIFDKSVNYFLSVPIVGSSLPIASGLAYAEKNKNIVVCFIGDAVLETGSFYETLNFISLKKLPLLIVIEDNELSTNTNKDSRRSKNFDISKIADGFGIKFFHNIGDDVVKVTQTTSQALDYVRSNEPAIVEFSTFRRYEHCGPDIDDNLNYRSSKVIESYSQRDPVTISYNYMVKELNVDKNLLDKLIHEIDLYVRTVLNDCIKDTIDYKNKIMIYDKI